jgi:hypothetical protein
MRDMIYSVKRKASANARLGATIARGCVVRNPAPAGVVSGGRGEGVRLRSVFLAIVLAALLAPARAGGADWSVRITPYDRLYPALELSRAASTPAASVPAHGLGSGSGLVAVKVRARHAGERVRVDIQAPGLQSPALLEATLASAGIEYELRPPLAWDAAALGAPGAIARSVMLQFRLTRDDVPAGRITRVASLRPLSEALYFVRDGRESVDLSWIFAAYVDEHDAVVDRIIDMALKNGIVETFDGYRGSTGAVYRQAWAVWQALAEHGIRYSAADPGIARGPLVFSQRVRLLDQTWSDRSANCIDGSVLIASALQRIGLRSFLVLVPGHAFVGFDTDAAASHAAYLETTLLGAPSPRSAAIPEFAAGFDAGTAHRLGLAGFVAALDAGARRQRHDAARLDNRHRPDYALIDIDAARAFGVAPIRVSRAAPATAQDRAAGEGAAVSSP